MNSEDAIARGHFAKKQLHCRDRLIAWSHARRFAKAIELARPFAEKRVLDYGCGDGTFLALLMTSNAAPARALGAEVAADVVSDCRARLARDRLSFATIAELDRDEHAGAFDAVFCMEVLEHVVALEPVIARLERVLAPGGSLVVSVPVEIGLPVLVKQAARRLAGWRGLGDYAHTSRYSIGEFARSVFAGAQQHIARPVYGEGDGAFHDHKGFNWRSLRARLAERFELERTLASPIGFLGPALASQAWFVMKKSKGAP